MDSSPRQNGGSSRGAGPLRPDSGSSTGGSAEGPSVRIHVGLEDVEDLIADLDSGFARMRAA